MKNVLIIGGGASGLMAAITAAQNGARVTLLEHNEKPGKKINATGNGKCNLTNLDQTGDVYRGEHVSFIKDIFAQFSVEDTLTFFQELGILPVNKNGYIYPRSGQASSVSDLLILKARSLGVKIKTKEHVTGCTFKDHLWTVRTEGWQYEADAVILASGSCASSVSGSDAGGYEIAGKLGHPVIKPLPALCALKLDGSKKLFSQWAGVRTEGRITLQIGEEKTIYQQQGELQLTEYGISGIPVFQLSRYAIRALECGEPVTLSIDFLPEIPEEKLTDFLQSRSQQCGWKNQKNGEHLLGLFPEKLIKVLISQKNLGQALKSLRFSVREGMDFSHAQVCSGGIDTVWINPKTMESLKKKQLFFAGEIVDIDGTCGGYNLQWAWSSGYVAGYHASRP